MREGPTLSNSCMLIRYMNPGNASVCCNRDFSAEMPSIDNPMNTLYCTPTHLQVKGECWICFTGHYPNIYYSAVSFL